MGWQSGKVISYENEIQTNVTIISEDSCLTAWGDLALVDEKICTIKENDKECPVSDLGSIYLKFPLIIPTLIPT